MQGEGKRIAESGVPEAAAKRAKTSSPHAKAAHKRGRGAKRAEQAGSVALSPLDATDTEAAEHGFHTISDWLTMPTDYTSTSQGSNRRLAGTAAQFFFAAQIGFSQIIMLNAHLAKTVDDNAVQIANLQKSAGENRPVLVGEVLRKVEREFAERLAQKERTYQWRRRPLKER
ncbi:unnamed protein product [Linum trigynum]|uniref:Uncharacterized protein n=1 Tax=Linum trigynum TaxID=586398 RepID=A0AAV2GBQ4_9ROSI